MNWLFYALLATGLFTIYDLLSRTLSVKSINPIAFSGVYYCLVGIIALIFLLIVPQDFLIKSLSFKIFLLTVFAMSIWSVFGRLEFYAKKLVEVSTFMVIIKFAPLVTLAISAVFFGEKFTLPKIIAFGLTIAANLLVVSRGMRIKISKGFGFAFLVALSLGVAWAIDKVVLPYFALPLYTLMGFVSPGILNLSLPPIGRKVLLREIKNISWPSTILLALVNGAGYLLLLKALSLGEASKVVLITSTSTILTILLGIVLLGEKKNVLRKVVAGSLVILATILLR